MTRTGTCCCGDVKIEVEGDPALHGLCHCDNCRRRTGSAFGMSAYFKEAAFRHVAGDVSCYALDAETGHQDRYFCTKCGTTVFWRAAPFKGMVGVASGSFTADPLPAPTFASLDHQRRDWLTTDPSIKSGLTKEDLEGLS